MDNLNICFQIYHSYHFEIVQLILKFTCICSTVLSVTLHDDVFLIFSYTVDIFQAQRIALPTHSHSRNSIAECSSDVIFWDALGSVIIVIYRCRRTDFLHFFIRRSSSPVRVAARRRRKSWFLISGHVTCIGVTRRPGRRRRKRMIAEEATAARRR